MFDQTPRASARRATAEDFATPEAREALAAGSAGLAGAVVVKLVRKWRLARRWADDLFAEAWLGVVKAARRFDPARDPAGVDGWGPSASVVAAQHARAFFVRQVGRHGFVGVGHATAGGAVELLPEFVVNVDPRGTRSGERPGAFDSLEARPERPPGAWDEDDWAAAAARLSSRALADTLLGYYRDGLNCRQLAAKFGLALPQSVQRRLDQARAELGDCAALGRWRPT